MGAWTDANGAFDQGLTYGPVHVTLSKFGYATTETALTVAGAPVKATLTLPESPSPYVEHAFEADGGSGWQTRRIEARAGGPLDVLVECRGAATGIPSVCSRSDSAAAASCFRMKRSGASRV
jgi:hypothetical protein